MAGSMEVHDDEEQIKMEILLGMTQEEGIPCLLCVMPRYLCDLTLNLTKLDLIPD